VKLFGFGFGFWQSFPATTNGDGKKFIAEPRTHTRFGFNGGERLKFGDIVIAVAYLAVINILLTSLLMGIFLPVISTGGKDVAIILGILLSSLIVGYMFAAKIQE
jgi:hypothetical protein